MDSATNPLPKWQLAIVYGIQLIEPLSGTVILSWLPDCIRRTGVTGGHESKVGYYSGIIGSVFFLTECLTVAFWGRASDVYGRRPILLLGPLGLSLSLLGFGLSSNFWWLLAFRAFQGIFNGNIGVAKTILAEVLDSHRIGDVYALMPVMWGLGNAIGPVVGGVLANPAERWPNTFGKLALFRDYPYILPCGVAAMLSLSVFICAFFSLQETLPSATRHERPCNAETHGLFDGSETTYGTIDSNNDCDGAERQSKRPSLRQIVTWGVLITTANYGWLFFLSMGYTVLFPLMYSTPITEGGLGFTPYKIGVIMATWGFVNALLQILCTGRILRRFGERRVFIGSAVVFFVGTLAFSFESFFAELAGKVDALVWMLIVFHLTSILVISTGLAAIQVLIVQSAPDPAVLGTVNGLAQMLSSGLRGVAPALASSLFSMTLDRNLAGGFMVYIIMSMLALMAVGSGCMIPRQF
ncbi:major facilitator superfamily domain-containing protein [Mucidula mucida]|nr:major facilitator superfamily domain-containing protein [Mucidula mucida]